MRRTKNLVIATAVTAVIGVVSCDGGAGGVDPSIGSWDYDRGELSQRERPVGGTADPPTNSEQPIDDLPSKNDNPPVTGGTTGGQAFVCSGIFECLLSGRTQTCITTNGERNCTPGQIVTIRVRIELQEVGGVCFVGDAVLEPNGTFRGDDDDEVGTWTRQGNGFYIQAGESAGLCVPSSGPVGLVDVDGQTASGTGSSTSSSGGSDDQAGSSSSSSSGQGNISIDPGTGQDGSSTSSSGG
jgi:hypothetical protein